ncbi:phage holin family protein [Noviherbaspirillum massiliense]|uniref:phage holin family protein n=1 Tax=Noviherbaspirillum massiliense TaxID=1465823 RepID=UPI0002F3DD74|nr:phage holin family protein [Noviherbaspirillum massiliense]
MRLLISWLIHAAALFVLPYVLPSIQVRDFTSALIAALVLGLVNALIRPILVLLTLPVTVLTLGLFILVINGLLFWAVANFVQGFHVTGFMAAVFGALLYSLISWILSALILK